MGGRFKLGRKIGSGSFGELYLGMSLGRFDSMVNSIFFAFNVVLFEKFL